MHIESSGFTYLRNWVGGKHFEHLEDLAFALNQIKSKYLLSSIRTGKQNRITIVK